MEYFLNSSSFSSRSLFSIRLMCLSCCLRKFSCNVNVVWFFIQYHMIFEYTGHLLSYQLQRPYMYLESLSCYLQLRIRLHSKSIEIVLASTIFFETSRALTYTQRIVSSTISKFTAWYITSTKLRSLKKPFNSKLPENLGRF